MIGIDCSKLLGPGVYVLRYRGKVAYTGRAEISMLAWVHAHGANKPGEYFPPMAKPVKFDSIEIYPCARGEVEHTWAQVYAKLYNPAIAEALLPTLRRRA